MEIEQPTLQELIGIAVREQMKNTPMSKVIPLAMYESLYGVTGNSVRQRLSKGVWKLGAEVLEVKGAGRHIDLEAVDEWARKQGKSQRHAA